MKRYCAVFECANYYAKPFLSKIAVVEFEAPDEEARAVEGPYLDLFEKRAWNRLFEFAGMPPNGYSSWQQVHTSVCELR